MRWEGLGEDESSSISPEVLPEIEQEHLAVCPKSCVPISVSHTIRRTHLCSCDPEFKAMKPQKNGHRTASPDAIETGQGASSSDADLVRAAWRGDKQAFVEIVARNQAMVCGV